jgi:phosphatidate cytidylyltransferase
MKETLMRILSAALILPIFIYAFQYSSGLYFIPFYIMGSIAIYLGLNEFYKLSDREDEGRAFRGTGNFFAHIIFFIYFFNFLFRQNKFEVPFFIGNMGKYFQAEYELVTVCIFLIVLISLILQILKRPLDGAIFSVSTTVVGVIYMVVPLGHFLKVLSLPNGIYYIYMTAGLTFITDAGAYFGGRLFGRHPAGLKISPKKTLEGYATGMVSAVIYCLIINFIWINVWKEAPPFGTIETILFAIVFSIISVAGDLAESAMKRDAKIKDSAGTIPGHGGFLDLADALLFTIPSCYFYLILKEMLGFSI